MTPPAHCTRPGLRVAGPLTEMSQVAVSPICQPADPSGWGSWCFSAAFIDHITFPIKHINSAWYVLKFHSPRSWIIAPIEGVHVRHFSNDLIKATTGHILTMPTLGWCLNYQLGVSSCRTESWTLRPNVNHFLGTPWIRQNIYLFWLSGI